MSRVLPSTMTEPHPLRYIALLLIYRKINNKIRIAVKF